MGGSRRPRSLGATDEMMLWNIERTASVRTIQAIIRTERPPTAAEFALLHKQLEGSHLARRPIAGTPGWLRPPRWSAPQAGTGQTVRESAPPTAVCSWLDDQAYSPLPADCCWRLSALDCGPVSVLSVTVPHLFTDGGGLITALGSDPQAIVRGAGLLPAHSPRARFAVTTVGDQPVGSGIRFGTSYSSIDTGSLKGQAAKHGVSANSVLLSVITDSYARLTGLRSVTIGIPFSTRDPAAPTGEANELTVVPWAVDPRMSLRKISQRVSEVRSSGELSPITVGPRTYGLLPTRWRKRVKKAGTASTELLISNFGPVVPSRITDVGGCPVDTVFIRTVNAPVLHRDRQRTRATVVAAGGRTSIQLTVSADPETVDPAELGRAIVHGLGEHHISARETGPLT